MQTEDKSMSINEATPQDWNRANIATDDHALNRYSFPGKDRSSNTQVQHIIPFKLPVDAQKRKSIPVYSGFFAYFPRAIAAVAEVSLAGGIQHGQTRETLHWDRPLSGDELDAMMRHMIDGDWEQVAWRAMAHLEKHLEKQEL